MQYGWEGRSEPTFGNMEKSLKHFVRRILGIHLLFLMLLLAVVSAGARHVYNSAREQAMEQAQIRQALLASQTAHGIGGFYDSILSDLGLLKPQDDETDLPAASQAPVDNKILATPGLIRQVSGLLLSRQLQGRAQLFMVDEQMHPHALGVDDRPNKPAGMMGKGPRPPLSPPPPDPMPAIDQAIIQKFGPWLRQQDRNSISGMEIVEQGDTRLAIKLVCVPMTPPSRPFGVIRQTPPPPPKRFWLVAAVSARPIEHNFLVDLMQNGVSGAFLVDETLTIMAASQHDLVGTRLDAVSAPQLADSLATFARSDHNATVSVDAPFRLNFQAREGFQAFEPSILSAAAVNPVKILGKPWFVVVVSPLKDVDKVVNNLAQKALFWTAFIAISVTTILVSTAKQLISSRLKMERERHQLLQNEMRQARQIQLAWLPQKTKGLCKDSLLDIATLNRPATHISGDFYNFFELPDGRTAVLIGDVTGHGTAAAFLMATTQLLLRNALPGFCDPGRALEEVNRQLSNQVFNGQFVTMQVLVIDPKTGWVQIATAGHPAPLINDGSGFRSLEIEPQLVAGVDSSMVYPTETFHLSPGSSLLLYTDGVVETEDRSGNRLRTEGLQSSLAGPMENAEQLLQRAVSAVNTFRRGEHLRDDLTLVAVHLNARAEAKALPNSDDQGSPLLALHEAVLSVKAG